MKKKLIILTGVIISTSSLASDKVDLRKEVLFLKNTMKIYSNHKGMKKDIESGFQRHEEISKRYEAVKKEVNSLTNQKSK
ncbi:MAG: hypothetical protein U9N59_16820 [Campylobacterota bacterium]|nr:hypothetical protein [Campylobacterota bacterium]